MMEHALVHRERVGVQDFVLLEDFRSEAAFIDNLRKRFNENIIYVSFRICVTNFHLVSKCIVKVLHYITHHHSYQNTALLWASHNKMREFLNFLSGNLTFNSLLVSWVCNQNYVMTMIIISSPDLHRQRAYIREPVQEPANLHGGEDQTILQKGFL